MARAVILINFGGPEHGDDVVRYLHAMFSDGDLMRLGVVQPVFAWLMSRLRAPKARRRYALMDHGGGSPLLDRTRAQAAALEVRLSDLGDVHVLLGMRYSTPTFAQLVQELDARSIERGVVLPMYPHPCAATTGSAKNAMLDALRGHPLLGDGRLQWVEDYAEHPAYVAALVSRVEQALEAPIVSPDGHREPPPAREVHLLFSAHNIPESLPKGGDPYVARIEATRRAVGRALEGRIGSHSLCWQSRGGPVRWLRPSAEEAMRDLHLRGVRHLVVVPLSFVCDNIENVVEVDVEQRAYAAKVGFDSFRTMPALNDHPRFIDALEDLARGGLGERTARDERPRAVP